MERWNMKSWVTVGAEIYIYPQDFIFDVPSFVWLLLRILFSEMFTVYIYKCLAILANLS